VKSLFLKGRALVVAAMFALSALAAGIGASATPAHAALNFCTKANYFGNPYGGPWGKVGERRSCTTSYYPGCWTFPATAWFAAGFGTKTSCQQYTWVP
jgi:hypothetical protein